MDESFGGGGGGTKAKEAANVVNRFLMELAIKCAKGEGINNYYDVSVIGYGSSVRSALSGNLGQTALQPISAIAETPSRLDKVMKRESDGAGGLVEVQIELPVWVESTATGSTPMCRALRKASDILTTWIADHPDSFPPTVLNVTDGETTDGDPIEAAGGLTQLTTSDGNILLYNCHLSASRAKPIRYPSSSEGLPDEFAVQLFTMSSELPPAHLETARGLGLDVWTGCRGFVFNGDVVDLISFVEIGTRAELG
jgi:hypothetical protein